MPVSEILGVTTSVGVAMEVGDELLTAQRFVLHPIKSTFKQSELTN